MKKIISLIRLAILVNLHMVGRFFIWLGSLVGLKPRSGYERFKENYMGEGIIPITPEERDLLPAFSGCIHCSLCALACPNVDALREAGIMIAPYQLAVTFSRSIPDFLYARDFLKDWTHCDECPGCVDVCPTNVPLPRIVAYIERLQREEKKIRDSNAV